MNPFFPQRFIREGLIWHSVSFPYIQPFIGFYYLQGHICLVSPFEEAGSLPTYLRANPNADVWLLVRFAGWAFPRIADSPAPRICQLSQTIQAIAFLHIHCKIIHGDIKGDNILIAQDGTARLCDFGLARPEDTATSTGMKGAGSVPWQSPELLNNAPKSFESDIYAFGIVIAEVCGICHFAGTDADSCLPPCRLLQARRRFLNTCFVRR